MAWNYLRFDEEQEYCEGEEARLPPERTVFLAFDVFRWDVRLGYREPGGYMSTLEPNVQDDCMIVAFAELSETDEVDISVIRARCAFLNDGYPIYSKEDCIVLVR